MDGAAPSPPPLSDPSEAELLRNYLGPRVASGQRFSWISEEDVYSAAPADLTARRPAVTAADGAKSWYFFTRAKVKKGHRGRMHRAVPSGRGSWYAERAAKPVVAILDDGRCEPLGCLHRFNFNQKGDDGRLHRSTWLMSELRLNDAAPEDLALCKIHESPRQDSAAARASTRNTTTPSTGTRAPEHHAPSPSSAAAPSPGDHHRAPIPSSLAAAPSPGDHHHAPSASSSAAAPTPSDDNHAPSPSSSAAAPTPGDDHHAPSTSTDASSSAARALGDPQGGPTPSTSLQTAPARGDHNGAGSTSLPATPTPGGDPSTPAEASTARWMLVQLGEEEEDGFTPVLQARCVEHMDNCHGSFRAEASSPLAGRKRKRWLLLHPAAKKARPGQCNLCCLAI